MNIDVHKRFVYIRSVMQFHHTNDTLVKIFL